jgi:nicotinate-nucleotide--dimethylbenzimidazole phosphoribosyltransferase
VEQLCKSHQVRWVSSEELAIWYASWRNTERPRINPPLFCGQSRRCKGVSAFPLEVTTEWWAILNGGAAINQLAKTFGDVEYVHADEIPTQVSTSAPR